MNVLLILQLHGIIILCKINQKRLQDLATAMNLRKRSLYLRKLRGIKQCRRFFGNRVVETSQAILKSGG